MADTEYIYKTYDNIIELELTEDDVPLEQLDYDAISRMTLDFDGTVVDSDVVGEGSGQPFDWTDEARLKLDLGKLTSPVLDKKTYKRVKHVVYSPENPNGLVWGFLTIVIA